MQWGNSRFKSIGLHKIVDNMDILYSDNMETVEDSAFRKDLGADAGLLTTLHSSVHASRFKI